MLARKITFAAWLRKDHSVLCSGYRALEPRFRGKGGKSGSLLPKSGQSPAVGVEDGLAISCGAIQLGAGLRQEPENIWECSVL